MESVEDCNLFMMCRSLCRQALSDIPEGYHVRTCRRDELELWYAFPYDEGAQEHCAAMARYTWPLLRCGVFPRATKTKS